MKLLMNVFIVCLLSVSAQAQTGPTLKDHMKNVGDQFKTLALALRAKKVSENELDAIESLQMSAAEASLLYPKKADTDTLKLKYSNLMAYLVRQALVLETQIEDTLTKSENPQDLTEITATINLMNDIRREGHELFKEE